MSVWARANGYRFGDRGRIPRRVLDAYNAANRSNVVDRSGSPRARPRTVEAIERLRLPAAPRRDYKIVVKVFVRDEDGTVQPYRPSLLSFEPRHSSVRAEPSSRPTPQTFKWPER